MRQFGKSSSEAVLRNGDSKVLVTGKDNLEPLIGKTIGFRGFLQARNGFTNVVATDIKVLDEQVSLDELPF